MIKSWEQFNESYDGDNQDNDEKDMDEVLGYVASNIPSDEIPALIAALETPVDESLNESFFSDLKDKLVKWFDVKIMDYIVNKKKDFYSDLIGKLEIFNLTDLSDIDENFRDFKLNENMNRFIEEGGNKFVLKYYDTPSILNPVRKEVDRTKNPKFGEEMGKFKSGEYEDSEDPRTFDEINKIFSKTIEPEDELIVNLCDAFFVGFNEYTSGGSFGELQQASFLNKPIFAWYIDDWKISGHSPWNLPHMSKIMRTTEDMKTFVKTMIDYKKK